MSDEDVYNQAAGGRMTAADLPKPRTFVIRQYRGLDDEGAPKSFDIAVSAHSVEPDNGDLFFTMMWVEDGVVKMGVVRAFARGTWSEFEEFRPSGLIS